MAEKGNCSWNLGSTTYSFNKEYYYYEKNFDDILADLGSLGKGTGVELILEQVDRHYPDLSPEIERKFKNAVEKYELVPSVLGGYDDPFYWNDDEAVEFLARQIKVANKLGFKKARILPWTNMKLTERLLPIAEKYDVVMLTEIHCPFSANHPYVQKAIRDFEKWDTPYVGLFPDTGTMCKDVSVVYMDRFRKQGVKEETLQLIRNMWLEHKNEKDIAEAVEKVDGSQLASLAVIESQAYFQHGDPNDLKDIAKWIKHVHMKFFYVDENLNENAVRIPEIVKVLKEIGYNDTISAEYEGHHWSAPASGLEQVNRLINLVRKSYDEA